MATMVVLIDGAAGALRLDTAAVTELGRLGVTSVTLVQDEAGVGVVLDGWAFDPRSAGERAAALLSDGHDRVRFLHPRLEGALCDAG